MSVTSPEVGTVGLRIALDYDNTYTADNVLWDAFIKLSVSLGHSVYIVTMRNPTLDAIAHALPKSRPSSTVTGTLSESTVQKYMESNLISGWTTSQKGFIWAHNSQKNNLKNGD